MTRQEIRATQVQVNRQEVKQGMEDKIFNKDSDPLGQKSAISVETGTATATVPSAMSADTDA